MPAARRISPDPSLQANDGIAQDDEATAIGPRLRSGGHVLVAGNDNDYSVTQLGATLTQFETYVDFAGHYARVPPRRGHGRDHDCDADRPEGR